MHCSMCYDSYSSGWTAANQQKQIRNRNRKRMRGKGNKSESDLGNNTGNSLDAWLHSLFHYLLAIKTLWKAKTLAVVCKNRRREKEERKRAFFLLMNKGNFIFCFSFGMARPTLCSVMRYSFCYNLQPAIGRTREWKRGKEKQKKKE